MTLTDRRRALMMAQKEGGRIPSAYQEVEWIGTNGVQDNPKVYIDTEIIPKSQNYRLVTQFRSPTTGTKGHFAVNYPTTYPTWILYQQSSNLYYKYGGNESGGISSFDTTAWYEIDFGKKLIVNGVVKTTKSNYDFSGNTNPLRLFSYGIGTSGSVNTLFKEIKIFDDQTLIADFVPCYRKRDEKIGFYDIVRQKFYCNNATGSYMTKGGNV